MKIPTKKMKSLGCRDVFDVIKAPLITEKATLISEKNQFAFKVAPWSNKFQIRRAVEEIFSVDVLKINTISLKGKTKRFKGRLGRRSDIKKAIVTIKEGQKIDLSVKA